MHARAEVAEAAADLGRSETSPLWRSWFHTRPPTRSSASRTSADLPAFARARAAVSPAIPAPTTITSARLEGVFFAFFFSVAAPAVGALAAAPAAAARGRAEQPAPVDPPVPAHRGDVTDPGVRGFQSR
jgi:hypothetical protein